VSPIATQTDSRIACRHAADFKLEGWVIAFQRSVADFASGDNARQALRAIENPLEECNLRRVRWILRSRQRKLHGEHMVGPQSGRGREQPDQALTQEPSAYQ